MDVSQDNYTIDQLKVYKGIKKSLFSTKRSTYKKGIHSFVVNFGNTNVL